MTAAEFQTWWGEFKVCFPDTRNWVIGLGRDDGQAMLNAWQRALSDVELQDAQEVTARYVRGDEEPIKAYEREQVAACVRRASVRCKEERLGTTRREDDRTRYQRPKGRVVTGNLAKALERVEELVVAGASPSSAAEQVYAEMPECFPEDNPYTLRRYSCVRCLDSGTLDVWTGKAAILVGQGNLTGREGSLTAAVFCDCSLGDRSKNQKTKTVRFNDYDFCECPHGDTTSIENRAKFQMWLENRKPRNYDRTLDDYNNQ